MEHHITFRDEFVPLILAGKKTQTRRKVVYPHLSKTGKASYGLECLLSLENGVATFQHSITDGYENYVVKSPYGVVGDKLWVRETWDEKFFPERHFAYKANDLEGNSLMSGVYEWKNAVSMPRHASRITLQIESLKIESVKEITESDAVAEGFVSDWENAGFSAINSFAEVFDDIYGFEAFEDNPFVWVYEFSICR